MIKYENGKYIRDEKMGEMGGEEEERDDEEGRKEEGSGSPSSLGLPQRKRREDLGWALWPSARSEGFTEPWANVTNRYNYKPLLFLYISIPYNNVTSINNINVY